MASVVVEGETMYPKNWKDIAVLVKEDAGWKCVKCGHPHEPKTGYTLTVHHINGVKEDCRVGNLVAACQRCHLRMQVFSEVIRYGQVSLF